MLYRTYASMKSEVLIEADMEAEEFLQPSEIMGYFNDAVREARAHIMKLGLEDDYFVKSVKASLTLNQETMDLPADIYAAKIRAFTYSTPSKVYPIRRMKGRNKYEEQQHIRQNPGSGEYLQYDLENPSPSDGMKIVFYPASQETTADCLVLNYVRNTLIITQDTDLVDVPEFYSFIKAFVKWKCYGKEGSALADELKAQYLAEKQLMLDTLAEMTPDNFSNNLESDLTIYEEMS